MGDNMNNKSIKDISLKEKQIMTKRAIAQRLMQIMTKHIGRENWISRESIFNKLFNKKFDSESMSDYVRWDFVKKAMTLCRTKTKCFISLEYYRGKYRFFVPRTMSETKGYKTILIKNMNALEAMLKRADKSVRYGWYKDTSSWKLEDKKKRNITHKTTQ